MYSPATPVKTRSMLTPAISSASFMAVRTDSVVPSMSVTTSRRMPPVRAWPTPRIFTPRPRGSATTSAMTAQVFVDPMSSPQPGSAACQFFPGYSATTIWSWKRPSIFITRASSGSTDRVASVAAAPFRCHHAGPCGRCKARRRQVRQRQVQLAQALGVGQRGQQYFRVRRVAQYQPHGVP
jgi:hypothetical protein